MGKKFLSTDRDLELRVACLELAIKAGAGPSNGTFNVVEVAQKFYDFAVWAPDEKESAT